MLQVRFHGRGGQGVVTAAELLSVAAFIDGKESQAFPSFGSERMGAPVMAFCRIDDTPIRLREPVSAPDALIIQDPTLLTDRNLFAGLTDGGFVLVNSGKDPRALGIDSIVERLPSGHVRTAPASDVARELLGKPLPNAALLGGFVALTSAVRLESLIAAIKQKFPGKIGEKNAQAAQKTYELIVGALSSAVV